MISNLIRNLPSAVRNQNESGFVKTPAHLGESLSVTVRTGRDGHSVGSIVYIGWNLPKTLVTRFGMWYSCRHDDSRRSCSSGTFVGREARCPMASSPRDVLMQGAGLAFAVQARAGAGGGGGGALRGVAVGGGGFPRPGGFAEVATRHLPEEAGSGRRGDEGSPPRGERRPIVEGGSGASGEAPVGSQGQVGRGPLGRVAVGGGRPAAQGGGPADHGSRPAGGPAGPGGAGVGDQTRRPSGGRAARSLGSMRSWGDCATRRRRSSRCPGRSTVWGSPWKSPGPRRSG